MKRKIFLQGKNINGEKFKIELTSNKIENLVNVPLEIKSKDKLIIHSDKIDKREKKNK